MEDLICIEGVDGDPIPGFEDQDVSWRRGSS